jgi:putative holliday junction resolvase
MATRIVGIDFGMARIGVAISDVMKIIASPLATVKVVKPSEKTVYSVIETIRKAEKDTGDTVEKVVIGLPYKMNGTLGLMGDEVKHFAEQLESKMGIPVVLWDERFTTVQAERAMREANMSRKKRSKIIDVTSAIVILQSFLAHLTC